MIARKRLGIFAAGIALASGIIPIACGSEDDGAPKLRPGNPSVVDGGDANDVDAAAASDASADPACQTQATLVTVHPTSIKHDSGMGRSIRDVRAFHGRLYFGFGDLNDNTGPVELVSFDPLTREFTPHITLDTESVERFVQVGDELWAPCSDGKGQPGAGCEYASGNANHEWVRHDFEVTVHVMDVVERVPGEAWLAGSSLLDDAGTMTGAFLWRSSNGSIQQMFPAPGGYIETGGGPFQSVAALDGILFAVTGSSVWTWDGATWLHARSPLAGNEPLLFGDFIHPVKVANKIVFATYGNYLWKFDGKRSERMNMRTFETPTSMGFTEAPAPIFDEAEGRLLLVNDVGDVLMSSDLETFRCIGKAPVDVRSVGSIDGTVYFGGSEGHIYKYEQKSW